MDVTVDGLSRYMNGENPKEWVKGVPLAEFWYNTNHHSFTQTTPFDVVYCQPPLVHFPYVLGESSVEAVDRSLQARQHAIQVLKFHLKRAQDRMVNIENRSRIKRQIDVGE
ncbi:retrotransposable element Tf2 [Tanacetum coccineum]